MFVVGAPGSATDDVRRQLEALGYDVCDGAVAQDDLPIRLDQSDAQIVLLDLDGIAPSVATQTLSSIRGQVGRPADRPVVCMASDVDVAAVERMISAGAHGWIAKPATGPALHAALQAAFFRHRADRREADERRQEREGLAAKGRVLDGLLKAMPDGIEVVDAVSRSVIANDQLYSLMAFDKASILASPDPLHASLMEMARRGEYGPGDPATLARERVAEMWRLLAERGPFRYERDFKHGRRIEGRIQTIEDGGYLAIYRDVTDEREREKERQRQSDMFRTILSSMGEGVAVFDRDLRIVAMNQQSVDLTGSDPAIVQPGAGLREIVVAQARAGEFGPVDPDVLADRTIHRILSGEQTVFERQRPNGCRLEVRYYPAPAGGFVAIYRDVTKERQRETELRRQSDLLEVILSSLGEGVAVFDRDLRLVTFNRQSIELTGVDPAIVRPGISLRDIFLAQARSGELGPVDPEQRVDRDMARLATESPAVFERVRPNGRRLEVRYYPAFDGGRVGIYRDVTDERRREDELRRQSDLLEAILSGMGEGIAVWDSALRLVVLNAEANLLTGTDPAVGKPGTSLHEIVVAQAKSGEFGPVDPTDFADRVVQELRPDQPSSYERLRPNGRFIEVRDRPMPGGGFVSLYVDITERKHAEQRIAQTNFLLDKVIEHIPGMLFLKRADDLRFERFNRAGEEMVGRPRDGVIGKTDHDIFPKAIADLYVTNARLVLAGGGQPDISEEPTATTSGETRWLQTSLTVLRDADGRPTHLLGVSIDITERKRAEDAVRELNDTLARRVADRTAALMANEERTRRIIETALEAVILIVADGRITGWNPQAEQIFGWRLGEVLGLNLFEIAFVERTWAIDEPSTANDLDLRRCLDDRDARILNRRLELPAVRRDGAEISVEIAIALLSSEDGSEYSIFVRDITARKAAQAELSAARMTLADAIGSMTQGLVLYDADDRVVLCNDSFVDQFRGIGDVIKPGVAFADLFRASVERGVTKVPADREVDDFIAERVAIHRRADGRQITRELADGRFLQVIERPARNGGIISTGTDVTELLRFERQLRDVQKMEAVGKLTGGMAHDFNNYLAVIIGSLDQIKEQADLDPEAGELVEAALDGALRAGELTRSLLAFSRRQPLDPRPTDLRRRIVAIADLLRRTLGEDITLSVHQASDLWTVRIDGAQLDSGIVNLANNARDAMPEGGQLTIATRNVRLDGAEAAEDGDGATGDYVLIEVTDTGTGMMPETMARVFDPFFTTKAPGHGSGLGLSMVYGFVKQSGGHIRLRSAVGQGTTVQIHLPRYTEVAMGPASQTPPVPPKAAADAQTILVVEDNALVRRAVVSQLTSAGYRVIEADSGDAAVKILEDDDQWVSLLFTDIVMPGKLDGHELALLALKRRPGLKVVLTSGFPGDRLKQAQGKTANLRLLGKPYRKADLMDALRAALDEPAGDPD